MGKRKSKNILAILPESEEAQEIIDKIKDKQNELEK